MALFLSVQDIFKDEYIISHFFLIVKGFEKKNINLYNLAKTADNKCSNLVKGV